MLLVAILARSMAWASLGSRVRVYALRLAAALASKLVAAAGGNSSSIPECRGRASHCNALGFPYDATFLRLPIGKDVAWEHYHVA